MRSGVLVGAVLALGLAGCATTSNDPRDPWEGFNRGVQSFNDGVDDYFLNPIARGYQWIMPSFADRGVTNFFSNIEDIRVTVNDFLQFKLKQGGSDGVRFLINSTIGVGGLFDVASVLDFEKHNEDFGQTLGAWGVPFGPYLVLPILGPSSPRDAVGLAGDAAMNPTFYIDYPAVTLGLTGLKLIDFKADQLSAYRISEEAAIDRYEFLRNAFIQRREYLVHDGNLPFEEEELLDEEELDEFDTFDEDEGEDDSS